MTRLLIPINDLQAAGGGPATNTVEFIDQAAGMYLDADGWTGSLMLVVNNSSTSTGYDVYILPGDNPPAIRAGLGTLTEEVTAGTFEALFIESARHAQDNGQIHIDFEAGMGGTIAAYRMPAGVS